RKLYDSMFLLSNRRQHTRSNRDWSSDVCSSDLAGSITSSRAFTVPSSATVMLPGLRSWCTTGTACASDRSAQIWAVTAPDKVQRLLNRACWNTNQVMRVVRSYGLLFVCVCGDDSFGNRPDLLR